MRVQRERERERERERNYSKIPKGYYLIFLIIALSIIPAVQAGFFESLLKITGWASTSDTTEPSVSVKNDTMVMLAIYVPTVTLTEVTITNVEMSYIVDHPRGTGYLINESTNVSFYKSGETTRVNDTSTIATACVAVVEGSNATTLNYTCTVTMWYWDIEGTWTVEAMAGDNKTNVTDTTTFSVNTLSAMNMTPTTLTWNELYIGDTDNLANNTPVIVTNTGNQNVTAINVEAINLIGETYGDYWIQAENFTVHTANACNTGTLMVNDTATTVSGAEITRGEAATDNLYVCLEEVNSSILEQIYSTTGNIEDWTVSITT